MVLKMTRVDCKSLYFQLAIVVLILIIGILFAIGANSGHTTNEFMKALGVTFITFGSLGTLYVLSMLILSYVINSKNNVKTATYAIKNES